MATVEFDLSEDNELPAVCLCCGDATTRAYSSFLLNCWGKTVRLNAPLCPLHQEYFFRRSLVYFIGLSGSVWVIGFFFLTFLSDVASWPIFFTFAGLWCLGWGLIWFMFWAGGVRLKSRKSGKIILTNVAPEFVEALRVLREIRLNNNQFLGATSLVGVQTFEDLTGAAGPLADDARRALEQASLYARYFHHDYVGTDHLLLGLRKVEIGGAGQVLKNCQLPVKLAEIEVQNISVPAAASPSHLPVTPQLKKVMQNAWEEARARGHSRLGTAHMLLGLVRQEEGIGTQILETFGLDLEDVRKQALRYLLQMDIAFFSASELELRTASDQGIMEKLP
jgi:hypothetical protein